MKNYLFLTGILLLSSCSLAQTRVKYASKSISPPKESSRTASVALPSETGDFRTDMLNMVNAVRSQGCKCGSKRMPPVAALSWNEQLEDASISHAKDMSDNNHFDHIGTDGSEVDTRAERAGYKWMQIGENIAWGYDNLHDAMIGWIKSPSHCLQLLSNKVTEMGGARNNKYWVQDFGKQRTW